jgi:hypothetical protein
MTWKTGGRIRGASIDSNGQNCKSSLPISFILEERNDERRDNQPMIVIIEQSLQRAQDCGICHKSSTNYKFCTNHDRDWNIFAPLKIPFWPLRNLPHVYKRPVVEEWMLRFPLLISFQRNPRPLLTKSRPLVSAIFSAAAFYATNSPPIQKMSMHSSVVIIGSGTPRAWCN